MPRDKFQAFVIIAHSSENTKLDRVFIVYDMLFEGKMIKNVTGSFACANDFVKDGTDGVIVLGQGEGRRRAARPPSLSIPI